MRFAPVYFRPAGWGILPVWIAWFAVIQTGSAQLPVLWDKTYGGGRYEELNGLLVRPDGIIAAGSTQSAELTGNPADFSWNFIVIKLDFNGKLLWKYVYGGDQDERLWNIIPTSDGGYLAGGSSWSGVSGDKSEPSRGGSDVWIVKLDQNGLLQWDKTFGGLYSDELFAMQEKPGGGYLLGCNSWSDSGGDKTENSRGIQDFWIISTDAWGNKLWDKTIGGSGYDQINDLVWAPDGNVYLSGGTVSDANTGDLGPSAARGGMDFLLVKFNPQSQKVLWTRRYGGTGEDYPYSLVVSPGGFIYLGGRSGSQPSPPMSDNNGKDAAFYGGPSDFWMLKLDENGNKIRDWSFGGDSLDDLYFIQPLEKGGFVLGGVSSSGISGNKNTAGHGGYDYWVLGVDDSGNKLWERTLGGTGNDALTRIAVRPNGALVLGGHSDSPKSYEKSENSFGVNDFWIVSTLCDMAGPITPYVTPCSREPVLLVAPSGFGPQTTQKWNTGAMTDSILAPAGTHASYSVSVYNAYGCILRDTIALNSDLPPVLNLGNRDTIVKEGTVLLIGNNHPEYQYQWNTGQQTPTIQVSENGVYTVTATDQTGCTATGEVQVIFKQSGVWVPNVFSPNLDGINDFITIYTDASVKQVLHFQIFDRWGDMIFHKQHFDYLPENEGWNGTYRNQPSGAGVYTWTAIVEYVDGSQEKFSGDITLVYKSRRY